LRLVNCDISIFANRSVQAIVEYHWETVYPILIKRLLVPFLCYLIVFQVYLEVLFNTHGQAQTESMKIYQYCVQALLLIFASYFMIHHINLLRVRKYEFFTMAMFWSMVDVVPLAANFISLGVSISS